MRAMVAVFALLTVSALFGPAAHAIATPEARCTAAKLEAAAQKARKRAKCLARGVLSGVGPSPSCLAQVEAKFADTWSRIEGRGGCATVGDASQIEDTVDAFVADILAALSLATTTTTTTTTPSCPPTTALYCGSSGCGLQGRCPSGMTCSDVPTCACEGPPIACGDVQAPLCRWGTCPAGMTCGTDPTSTDCPPACACH